MTVARAALGARVHPLRSVTAPLPDAARWAAMAHISVVTVPAVLAADGDARAYLAGAGVMALLGAKLGRGHSAAGRHATRTAGAPAAAVAAGLAADDGQEAFGTQGKSLQAGFAADAGVRAARPAQAGATADPRVLEAWLERVGGKPATDFPANPGRPRKPRPVTGLEGKFSLPYAVAAALLDDCPGFDSFTDGAVRRPAAQTLVDRVHADLPADGSSSLGRSDLPAHRPCRRPRGAHRAGAATRRTRASAVRRRRAGRGCRPRTRPALLVGQTWTGAAEPPRKHFPYIPYEGQET
ncbi:hypothetical protein ACWDBW_06240 [Streptomyces sp. NPDC001107]